MNAGMYGMADGRGMAGRKVVGTTFGTAVVRDLNSPATYASIVCGRNLEGISLTAGVRTKLLSISGRGAIRLAAFNNSAGSGATYTHELWIDGVLTRSYVLPSAGASGGGMLVGFGPTNNTYGSVVGDYVPFDASCEVYLTSNSGGSAYYFHMVDLHQ